MGQSKLVEGRHHVSPIEAEPISRLQQPCWQWIPTHDGPKTHQRRTQPPQQETRHQNALHRRVGVLHLLDAIIRHKHHSVVQPLDHIPLHRLHQHILLPLAGVYQQLLQPHYLLLHELRLQEVVPQSLPMCQEVQEQEEIDDERLWVQHGVEMDEQIVWSARLTCCVWGVKIVYTM